MPSPHYDDEDDDSVYDTQALPNSLGLACTLAALIALVLISLYLVL